MKHISDAVYEQYVKEEQRKNLVEGFKNTIKHLNLEELLRFAEQFKLDKQIQQLAKDEFIIRTNSIIDSWRKEDYEKELYKLPQPMYAIGVDPYSDKELEQSGISMGIITGQKDGTIKVEYLTKQDGQDK